MNIKKLYDMKEKSSNLKPMANGFSEITLKVIAALIAKGFTNYVRSALLLLGLFNDCYITINSI